MTININLLPWREEKIERRKQQVILLISFFAGLTFFLVLSMHCILSYQIAKQEALNERLRAENIELNKKIMAISELKKEKENLLTRMEVIQQLQRDRPKIVQLFDTISRIIPDGLYLTNLTRTGNHIFMEGKAESNTRVSKFMRNMESSKVLTHPILTFIQADDTVPMNHGIDFSLQATQRMDAG